MCSKTESGILSVKRAGRDRGGGGVCLELPLTSAGSRSPCAQASRGLTGRRGAGGEEQESRC